MGRSRKRLHNIATSRQKSDTVHTGRVRFFASPGSKLPGLRRAQSSRYHHSVPLGQKAFLRPVRKIDSSSLHAAGFEESLSAVAFALCSTSASQARRAPRRVRERRCPKLLQTPLDFRDL